MNLTPLAAMTCGRVSTGRAHQPKKTPPKHARIRTPRHLIRTRCGVRSSARSPGVSGVLGRALGPAIMRHAYWGRLGEEGKRPKRSKQPAQPRRVGINMGHNKGTTRAQQGHPRTSVILSAQSRSKPRSAMERYTTVVSNPISLMKPAHLTQQTPPNWE